ncbi:MAG: hypothetical protein IPP49_02095 [Saprospiraceae bacterium]|nr:hypothetical protein [Saprospiraceae bacterium]
MTFDTDYMLIHAGILYPNFHIESDIILLETEKEFKDSKDFYPADHSGFLYWVRSVRRDKITMNTHPEILDDSRLQ